VGYARAATFHGEAGNPAQRQLYSEAKKVQGLQILVSTPAVIVWSLAALSMPAVKVYAALWACLATLADVLCFAPMIKAKKAAAAKIQEEFDCEVLDLPWSDCKLGEHPEPESVSNYRTLAEHDPELTTFRDWYPILVGDVPLHIGRLICQRSSCWWDRTLREKYARTSLSILLGGMVVIVIIAMLSGATVIRKCRPHHRRIQGRRRLPARPATMPVWPCATGSQDHRPHYESPRCPCPLPRTIIVSRRAFVKCAKPIPASRLAAGKPGLACSFGERHPHFRRLHRPAFNQSYEFFGVGEADNHASEKAGEQRLAFTAG
jgi:SMODS-associating 4TM effector domain